VERFALLGHILKSAGLPSDEVSFCLNKYLHTLPPKDFATLITWLPHLKGLSEGWCHAAEDIAELEGDKNNVEVVPPTAWRAKLRFIEQLESGHGEHGWLRELPHAQARDANASHLGGHMAADTAWFSKPDCALWLAIMARIRIVLPREDWVYPRTEASRDAYRDGWRGVFGIQRKTTVSSAPRVNWSDIAQGKAPAALPATYYPFLTTDFFSVLTHNPGYLRLIKDLPGLAKQAAYELRQQGLPKFEQKADGNPHGKGVGKMEGKQGKKMKGKQGRQGKREKIAQVPEPVKQDDEWTVVVGRRRAGSRQRAT
jgi:hypothetical protein